MAESSKLRCSICRKTYSRADHLKRHVRSHGAARAYKCSSCGKSFRRGDVLKRHYQSCLDGLLRVSASHAPHNEARIKSTQEEISKGCFSQFQISAPDHSQTHLPGTDLDQGDASILLQSQRSEGTGESDILDIHDGLATTQEQWPATGNRDVWHPEPSCPSMSADFSFLETYIVSQAPTQSFAFLLQFTSGVKLTQAFGDPAQPLNFIGPEMCSSPSSSRTESVSIDDMISLPWDKSGVLPLTSGRNAISSGCQTVDGTSFPSTTHGTISLNPVNKSILVEKSRQILAGLKHLKDLSGSCKCHYTESRDTIAADFFSAFRLSSHLDHYWSNWHPNLPIIHRPWFNVLSAPSCLLASMAIMGGRYSANSRDQAESRALFNDVEELVFHELSTVISHLAKISHLTNNLQPQRQHVQALQAAYIVLVYQSWDGSVADRHKARRHRFSQMIETMQLLGIGKAKHRDYRCTSVDEFDWLQFVEMEELTRIFVWCSLIDAAFVTFYNIAPRLGLRELRMGLPSPETCFEATSSETCLFELQKWQYQVDFDAETTLYDFLKSFCGAEMDFATQLRVASHSTISLFCIASAFHVMLFNSDPEIGALSQYDPILTGLSNWRAVWNRKSMLSGEQISQQAIGVTSHDATRTGFWNYCPEYWLLAHVIVKEIIKTKSVNSNGRPMLAGASSAVSGYDEMTQGKLHDFIQSYQCGSLAL